MNNLSSSLLKLSLVSAILAGTGASAAPLLAVGDNAQLFFTTAAAVKSDDNIYLNNKGAVSDTIWSLQPGLELDFGHNASTQGRLSYAEDFLRYTSHSTQNKSLANVGLVSGYSDGKSKLDFNASYVELAQNDVTIPGFIVDRNLTDIKLSGETAVSQKTAVGVGVAYDKTAYGPASYIGTEEYSVPLDAYFEITPKLQASAGYRYRTVSFSHSIPDAKDNFFNVGARGEFTPKLTGQLRVGYNTRSMSGQAKQNGLGVDSGFTYAFSEKTGINFGMTNDFNASAFGQSTKDRNLFINADNKIDDQWSWNVGLSYRTIDYPVGRSGVAIATTDNYLEGSVGVAYVYNTHLNFQAGYLRRHNSSDLSSATFSNNVFSLGANIRY